MTKPFYESDKIAIYEWSYPICEIKDKEKDCYVHIKTPEDAKALICSLVSMLNSIPFEFGGYKQESKDD